MPVLAPTLRVIQPEDRDFLFRVYAGTRAEELALTDWDETQKQAFLAQQFEAQHHHYQTHYQGARFDLILLDGEPVGRLYVARWKKEIRIMDIALLPDYRNRGIGRKFVDTLKIEGQSRGWDRLRWVIPPPVDAAATGLPTDTALYEEIATPSTSKLYDIIIDPLSRKS